jgi:hypothetical protein
MQKQKNQQTSTAISIRSNCAKSFVTREGGKTLGNRLDGDPYTDTNIKPLLSARKILTQKILRIVLASWG